MRRGWPHQEWPEQELKVPEIPAVRPHALHWTTVTRNPGTGVTREERVRLLSTTSIASTTSVTLPLTCLFISRSLVMLVSVNPFP